MPLLGQHNILLRERVAATGGRRVNSGKRGQGRGAKLHTYDGQWGTHGGGRLGEVPTMWEVWTGGEDCGGEEEGGVVH